MQNFVKWLPPRKGAQVLDLGSGHNGWAIGMAELGYRVTAVDTRPQSIFHLNMTYVQADMFEWLRSLDPDVKFDGIFVRYVIHLFPKKVVTEELMPLLRKHLAPGGVIALETFYMPPSPPFDEDHRHPSYWTSNDLWELVSDMKVCDDDEVASPRLDMEGNERLFFSSFIVAKDTKVEA